jgi:hypothetical protein
MSDNPTLLKDIFIVRAQQDLCDLSVEDKVKFCDSAMSGSTENRGITVTFNLSSSARRINNRIYTPKGQRAGLATWTKPYGKPILLHHDRSKDPIGRILAVDYVENDQEAMRFFRSVQDFVNFKSAVESDDPAAIFKGLMDNNLVGNPEWPGLGHLRARARITDRDAIQKFLDQRYLTFSAGSHSDRYVCSICSEDWAKGDMCEHMPGRMSEDGLPTVFITGTFYGDEASIVNEPANSLSTVHSIEFSDSVDRDRFDPQSIRIDPTTIYSVDSITTKGEPMPVTNGTENSQDETVETDLDKLMKALADAKTEILALVQAQILEATKTVEAPAAVAAVADTAQVDQEEQVAEVVVETTDAAPCAACTALQKDYEAALLRIETLQQDVENLKNSQTALDTADTTGKNVDDESTSTQLPAKVENPSIAGHGAGTQVAAAKLGDYERNIVTRYQDILNKQGKATADMFLQRKKAARHIPLNFNPTQYIQESD